MTTKPSAHTLNPFPIHGVRAVFAGATLAMMALDGRYLGTVTVEDTRAIAPSTAKPSQFSVLGQWCEVSALPAIWPVDMDSPVGVALVPNSPETVAAHVATALLEGTMSQAQVGDMARHAIAHAGTVGSAGTAAAAANLEDDQ